MKCQVTLRGRQDNAKIIQSVLSSAVQQYKQETGKDVEITLDVNSHLSSDSCGSIELFIHFARTIKVRKLIFYAFKNDRVSFTKCVSQKSAFFVSFRYRTCKGFSIQS
jgi:ATP synthase (E/31 kDa) subunit